MHKLQNTRVQLRNIAPATPRPRLAKLIFTLLPLFATVVGGIAGTPAATAWGQPRRVADIGRPTRTSQIRVEMACDGASSTVRGCNHASLAAINSARAAEGIGPLVLPVGYRHLDVVQQVVIVTNAERVARGLPPLHGPNGTLGQLAQRAVYARSDPNGPTGMTWSSNFANGVLTVLEADFEWMYNDGPGGTNTDCRAPAYSGCWAHRDNILSRWPGTMGAAGQPSGGRRLAVAELMVAVPI